MATLLDTSVLARLANSADVQHASAVQAVLSLHRRGEPLCITPQVLIELRSVATRPQQLNGLGLSTADAKALADGFESSFSMLEETARIFPAWKALVDSLGIVGKQVHDARLVAVCQVHGVAQLMSFNVSHFARMAQAAPSVVPIHPDRV